MSENNNGYFDQEPTRIDFCADFDQDVNGVRHGQQNNGQSGQSAQQNFGQPGFTQPGANQQSPRPWAQQNFYAPNQAQPVQQKPRSKKRIAGIAAAVVAALALQGGLIFAGVQALNGGFERQIESQQQYVPGNTQLGEQQYTAPTKKQSKGVAIIDTTGPSGGGSGTGMVITSDGQILTNYHVVKGSDHIRVTIASTGKSYSATLLGRDAVSDVAVLKIDAEGLDTVTMNGDGVSVGEEVTTVGNASGGGKLVASPGEVSAVGQRINVGDQTGGSQQTLLGMIRTTTAAVPGDSGGPTFNKKNEVIGVTSAAASDNGESTESTSFVIPINYALDLAKQIVNKQASGTIKIGPRAQLGVMVRDASDGYNTVGALVAQASGPAADAGIQSGDIIVGVNGKKVSSASALTQILEQYGPEQKIEVQVLTNSGSHQSEQGETRMSDFTQKSYTVTLGVSDVN